MGAWGYGLTESDNALDYIDELEGDYELKLHEILNGDISQKNLNSTKKEFLKHKKDIFKYTKETNTDYSGGTEILIYSALMSLFEEELSNKELKEYKKGYKSAIDDLDSWGNAKEREEILKKLNKTILNKERYIFSHKGLFQVMDEKSNPKEKEKNLDDVTLIL